MNCLHLTLDKYIRYGREDEELMGLGFYNEILMAAEQIYPSANDAKRDRNAVASREFGFRICTTRKALWHCHSS